MLILHRVICHGGKTTCIRRDMKLLTSTGGHSSATNTPTGPKIAALCQDERVRALTRSKRLRSVLLFSTTHFQFAKINLHGGRAQGHCFEAIERRHVRQVIQFPKLDTFPVLVDTRFWPVSFRYGSPLIAQCESVLCRRFRIWRHLKIGANRRGRCTKKPNRNRGGSPHNATFGDPVQASRSPSTVAIALLRIPSSTL